MTNEELKNLKPKAILESTRGECQYVGECDHEEFPYVVMFKISGNLDRYTTRGMLNFKIIKPKKKMFAYLVYNHHQHFTNRQVLSFTCVENNLFGKDRAPQFDFEIDE